MAGFVHWNGDPFRRFIDDKVSAKMREMGEVGVAEAKRLVPVDTGQLRDSIGYVYRQSDKTLQLYADKYYAVFIEWGTRRAPAQPFLRPAMAKMAKVWGGGAVNLEIATPMTARRYAAGYRAYVGSHITVGRRGFFGKRKARVLIGHHGHRNPRAGPL